MKRFTLAASIALAALLPGLALAQTPTRAHVREYNQTYTAVVQQFGKRTPGRNILKNGFDNHRGATDSDVVASLAVLKRMLAPPPAPAVQTASTPDTSTDSGGSSASSSGGLGDVPGVPGSFAACVAQRESTDGQGSSDIYGILPSNGYSGGMSVGQQKALFSQMYQADGTSPWSPYDGC